MIVVAVIVIVIIIMELQWRHMSVMASKVNHNPTVCWTDLLNNKDITKFRITGLLWGESPTKGQLSDKHIDVIMIMLNLMIIIYLLVLCSRKWI